MYLDGEQAALSGESPTTLTVCMPLPAFPLHCRTACYLPCHLFAACPFPLLRAALIFLLSCAARRYLGECRPLLYLFLLATWASPLHSLEHEVPKGGQMAPRRSKTVLHMRQEWGLLARLMHLMKAVVSPSEFPSLSITLVHCTLCSDVLISATLVFLSPTTVFEILVLLRSHLSAQTKVYVLDPARSAFMATSVTMHCSYD